MGVVWRGWNRETAWQDCVTRVLRWVFPLDFWGKSRTKRSFWRLDVTFGGSLVRNARFGDLTCDFWRKSRTKSALQECPTRVSYKSVPQECPTRVSHKSFLQECPTRVSHKECPARVSYKCPARVSHKSVPYGGPEECPTRVSRKSVSQECPLRVSHKSVL